MRMSLQFIQNNNITKIFTSMSRHIQLPTWTATKDNLKPFLAGALTATIS